MEIYKRSASFLLVYSFKKTFPGGRVYIGHSLERGFYFEPDLKREFTEKDLAALDAAIKDNIARNIPFTLKEHDFGRAWELFDANKMKDKLMLMAHIKHRSVPLYLCDDYFDLYYSPLVPSSGYITSFSLKYYPPGFILQFPNPRMPEKLPPQHGQKKLFAIYKESKNWSKILEVYNIGKLNKLIIEDGGSEIIKVAEALHEKKISNIADIITERSGNIKLILISGPSASGKTTFSKRLAIHLRVNGIKTYPISMDNYFVDRDKTPRDAEGNLDFESIKAVDIELFNRQMKSLLKGETIEVPDFDFKTGSRRPSGNKLSIGPGEMIIIEGIHGLNKLLCGNIPFKNKYKIYVSALTQLNIDDYNRIPTSYCRILRRIVRDNKFRHYSALDTIKRWPSIRKGESRYIFPFQENANIMFNTALVYELAVLKKYAEPLLKDIKEDSIDGITATKLAEFLSFFLKIEDEEVPGTSILREFIGDSSFHY